MGAYTSVGRTQKQLCLRQQGTLCLWWVKKGKILGLRKSLSDKTAHFSCMVDDQMGAVNLKRQGQRRSRNPTETIKT
jgi:hypothetical protein